MELDLTSSAVLAMAGLIFIQSFILAITLFKVSNFLSRLESRSAKFSQRAGKLLKRLDQVLETSGVYARKLPDLDGGLQRVLPMLSRWTGRLDSMAGQGLNQVRKGLQKAVGHSDLVLAKFSRGSYQVHQALINPSRQISSALSALQASIARLFQPHEAPPPKHHPDEQIFI